MSQSHPAVGRTSGTSVELVETTFRSGFACLVGRPNAGKSTLLNALVGTKVAIVSDKPQTTRHAIRGIVNMTSVEPVETTSSPTPAGFDQLNQRFDAQLVLIDTPGLSKPRALLQQRLNDLVAETLADVDVVTVCFPADQHVGPGDKRIVEQLASLKRRPLLVAAATKADAVKPDRLARHLLEVEAAGTEAGVEWVHIVPCSGLTGWQVDELKSVLVSLLEPGPQFYPGGEVTDEPSAVMIAELIREAALERVRDELPHSIAVEVDEINPRPDRPEDKPIWDVFANLIVERDSQKHIVIGRGGAMIRDIGTAARLRINALLDMHVHLDLRVKVAPNWQTDARQLNRLGF